MFHTNRNIFSGLAFSLALLSGSVHAANSSDYGIATNAVPADRQLELTPGARYANVTNGESVRFVAGDQSFVWHFATLHSETSVNLGEIAPKNWPLPSVRVYVASNPTYRN